MTIDRRIAFVPLAVIAASGFGCRHAPAGPTRATGYVEATEVRVAPEVGGRILAVDVAEGDHVAAGQVLARIDTADTELALRQVMAQRQQAQAQLALLLAGSRPEDVQQAAAQRQSALADAKAARVELDAANADVKRFEDLLRANAGSVKQRDDAVTRRDVADARVRAADERARAAEEMLAKVKGGARSQEIDAARAHVSATDAQIATLQKNLSDAVLKAPVGGIVTTKLLDAGEMVAPHVPIVAVTDIDHAWANVYVDEPLVPKLKIGQAATIVTDAGQRLAGTITFVSPNAEFTPRNVQTAEERSKLVYRIKVTVDNRSGALKPGMPVEAELPSAGAQ